MSRVPGRTTPPAFDPDCRLCPRLAGFLDAVGSDYPDYHARPVPPFGDPQARLLIVGLAPGLHGANATGRPFTGDHAGIILYETLHRFGFASRPESVAADDGLMLHGCRITNAVKCLPPQNAPKAIELQNCAGFLRAELSALCPVAMRKPRVIIALGGVAHRAVRGALGLKREGFAHGAQIEIAKRVHMLSSIHPSRLNVNTKRLSAAMLDQIFATARVLLG